ncbi:MAG: hypothetical protein NE327_12430 [Lentisphaeraceae bacterium]|nr:hypothetical protein [Lentisphaeraceae bacterium]
MKRVYAFGSQLDFENAKYAGEKIRSQDKSPPVVNAQKQSRSIFAKVTELVADTDDKQAKGIEVVYNISNQSFEDPVPSLWTFDSDNLDDDYTTTDIYSNLALEVDEIVEIIQIPDSENEESVNLAVKSGSSQSIVIIPRSVDGNDYTADIVDGFTNQNVISSGHLARIGSGETSNNQAPIDHPYSVTRIEKDGEDTVYYFQPPVLF